MSFFLWESLTSDVGLHSREGPQGMILAWFKQSAYDIAAAHPVKQEGGGVATLASFDLELQHHRRRRSLAHSFVLPTIHTLNYSLGPSHLSGASTDAEKMFSSAGYIS